MPWFPLALWLRCFWVVLCLQWNQLWLINSIRKLKYEIFQINSKCIFENYKWFQTLKSIHHLLQNYVFSGINVASNYAHFSTWLLTTDLTGKKNLRLKFAVLRRFIHLSLHSKIVSINAYNFLSGCGTTVLSGFFIFLTSASQIFKKPFRKQRWLAALAAAC